MEQYFLGAIRLFSFNFCPTDHVFCDGAAMSIAKNTALYSLLGSSFGGDAHTTFCVPDMRGRVAVCPGMHHYIADTGGAATVVLAKAQMPLIPIAGVTATTATKGINVLSPTKGDDKKEIFSVMQPSLGINFCIVTTGTYPPRKQ
jgi:microcystin-dependent protein